jgi:DNA-directed RNA polymerase beta subunit/intein/homing endonuclease
MTEQLTDFLTYDKIFDLMDCRFSKKNVLYEHLHNSFNELVIQIINYLEKNKNIFEESRVGDKLYRYRFKYENLHVRPPLNENGESLLYPMDAIEKNSTYSIKFIAKISQIQEIYDLTKKEIISEKNLGTYDKEVAVIIPNMVHSKYCSLEINKDYAQRECPLNPGGYFIVNGAEKIVLSLEKMVENKPLVFVKKDAGVNNYEVKINSRSNDPNVIPQGIQIKLKKNFDITIKVPILNEISVFVLMRALGLETDRDIVKYIVYNDNDIDMLNILKIAVDLSKKDGKKLILTKEDAYYSLTNKLRVVKKYIDKDKKLQYEEKKEHLEALLRNAFLPHINSERFDNVLKVKAIFLGYMINKLLQCYLGRTKPDDRDSFVNKRVDMPGDLIFDLYKQYHKKMLNECNKFFKKRNGGNHDTPLLIINQLKPSIIEQGIKSAMLTGNWGKKKGVAQMYPRLTYLQSASFLRRVDAPSADATASKLTGPRHYHPSQTGFLCLTGDTEILMSDGTIKLIKNVKNGDSVVSIDKETMEEISTPIHNWFKQDCEKLLKLTTITGRTIKCTPEHKLLTKVGDKYDFIEVQNMRVGDYLISRHAPKYIKQDKETDLIIDSSDISEQYKTELFELCYLDRKIPQWKLEILARLIGLNITDGHLGIRSNQKYYDCAFSVGEEKDAFDLLDDIMKLGFGTPSISKCLTKHTNAKNGKVTIHNTYSVSKNGAFAYLLHKLGAFVGKKTEQARTVPEWIINSNNRIQREFISGYISGDGCRLSINKNQNMYKIHCGQIGQVTNKDNIESTINYLNQVSQILTKFNITNNVSYYDKPDENDKYKCYINIDQSYENLNNYADIINFRYCNEKRRKSALTIEYIKHKNHYADIKTDMYNNIIKLYSTGIGCTEISNTNNYPYQIVKRIIENHRKGKIPKARQLGNDLCLSYEEFIKDININNENFLIKIKSIEEIPAEPVYDFETKYFTHSFVADSLYSSNCSVESPEHANIGLVKHLSMLSSITIGSADQANVLYDMITNNKLFIHMNNHTTLDLAESTKIFLNGEWIGFTKNPLEMYKELRMLKTNSVINRTNGIVHDISRGEIKVYTDSGRLYRPIINVKDNSIILSPKIIDEFFKDNNLTNNLNKWDMLMMKYPEAIDILDCEEQYYALIARNIKEVMEMKLREKQVIPDNNEPIVNRYDDSMILNYTHCEFHSSMMIGIISANIPFANHNAAARNIFSFAQMKQAMGWYTTNYRDRADISYILYHTQKPIVNTRLAKYIHTDILPCGENAIVMAGCYSGHNQDDSIVFNQTAIDRGLFRSASLKKWSSKIEKNQSTSQDDIFMKPDQSKLAGTRHAVYDKLNDKGYVPEETTIFNGDVIIGKVTPIQPAPGSNKCYKDASEIYKSGEPAIIDKVFLTTDSEGSDMIKMRTRSIRIPKIGDKFCCFLSDHDVLTSTGWKKINEITKDDKVASLVDGNTLVYKNPTELQEYDYDGDLYKIESNQVNLIVTPNHRMYVGDRTGRNYKIELAETIYGKRKCYKKNVENYSVSEKHTLLSYYDKNLNKEVFEPVGFILKNEEDINDIKILDIDAWLSFFGIWMAEGWASNTKRLLQVSFAAHKQRVKDELIKVCRILGYEITTKKDDINANEENIWSVSDKKLRKYMENLSVGAVNKSLPDWVWYLTKEQCRILIDGMMLGDGHTMNNGTRRYDTSSSKLADDFQRLCLHAGWSCNKIVKYGAGHKATTSYGEVIKSTKDAYRLTVITSQNNPLVNKNIKSDGSNRHDSYINFESDELKDCIRNKVYCCTVPGEGIIYVRRNGYPAWCGQSRHGQKGTIGLTMNQSDMPFTEEGISPDLIINPHCIPKRMTVGQLVECLVGKVAAVKGVEADGTPFNEIDIEKVKDELEKLGYERNATEWVYCGLTGQRLKIPIFIGPTYYQRLKHLVMDKHLSITGGCGIARSQF